LRFEQAGGGITHRSTQKYMRQVLAHLPLSGASRHMCDIVVIVGGFVARHGVFVPVFLSL
jgi:hypothetical protein